MEAYFPDWARLQKGRIAPSVTLLNSLSTDKDEGAEEEWLEWQLKRQESYICSEYKAVIIYTMWWIPVDTKEKNISMTFDNCI